MGHLFHDLNTSFVAPLLPVIIEKLSLSLTSVGFLTTLMRVPAVFHPVLGITADKIGARNFVIAAPALTATFLGLLGVAPSPALIGLLLLFAGFSSAVFHAASPPLTAKVSKDRTGLGMSIFMAGGGLGRTLGPLLIVWAVSQWGLEGTYRLILLGWATSLVLLWQLGDLELQTRQNLGLRRAFPAFKALFLPLAFILLLRSFFIAVTNTYLPTFMTQAGAPLWMAGASLSTLEIAGVGGSLFVGPFSDSMGRKRTLMIAMFLSSLSLLGFLQVSGWAVVPFLIILGFASKSTGTVFLALIQDQFTEHRATGNGVFMFLSFISNAVMLLVIGLIGDRTGLRTAYYLGVLAAFLTIPLLLLLPEENPNPS